MGQKIGIAVTTTPDCEESFLQWYEAYKQFAPTISLYIHTDALYKGIVYSKNKCIEALYDNGVTDFFIFDDDLMINSPDWCNAYINSGLKHACWNYNRPLRQKQQYYWEYETPNGCMLYFKRKCFDKVGGFDTDFSGYSYEHVNISDRIFNSGLTPARYIDIPDSQDLFKMIDRPSAVSNDIRRENIPINNMLYRAKFYSKEYKEFRS